MQLKLDTAPAREQEQEPEQEHRGHGDNLAAKLGIVKLGKVAGKVGGQMACSLSVGLYSVECSGYTHHNTSSYSSDRRIQNPDDSLEIV